MAEGRDLCSGVPMQQRRCDRTPVPWLRASLWSARMRPFGHAAVTTRCCGGRLCVALGMRNHALFCQELCCMEGFHVEEAFWDGMDDGGSKEATRHRRTGSRICDAPGGSPTMSVSRRCRLWSATSWSS